MLHTREQICELTSRKLADKLASPPSLKATVGLDGFVDSVVAVVDKRTAGQYQPVRTIDHFGAMILKGAGASSNYELVIKERRAAGSGPTMASALLSLGFDVTYIGNLGYPDIDPVFQPLASRARILSIAEPGHADALEFENGRVTLGKHDSLGQVNWDNLIARVGKQALTQLLDGSHLIGMVNWTMLPNMSRIWAKMLDEIVPNAERHSRKLFIDLADTERHSDEDILDALKLLTRFQDQIDVVLGLNLKESLEVADVLGLPGASDPESAIEENARAIREELHLACVVVHPRRSAAAATEGQSARFVGPFVSQPKTSIGAGDHFNAGFCLGLLLGLTLEESLCCGTATSGYYVRTAQSPTLDQLSHFICSLPAPQ